VRRYTYSGTLETASFADDGLEVVRSWGAGESIQVVLTPASAGDVERARLASVRVTHQFLLPRGVSVRANESRLTVDGVQYEVRLVEVSPRFVRALAEGPA
jgi:hypothetical protein